MLGSERMCGIAGHLAFPAAAAEPARVRRMAQALAHRGPDGEGFHETPRCVLGHRRLSIIDPLGGAQPLFSEDGQIAVVCNGEIYNYRELRRELAPRHDLRTNSDCEVLAHLYEEEGEAMLSRLRGMFALALWDGRRERLMLARDPFGEKPLLYAQRPEGLFFASELGALRAGVPELGALDRAALSDYLELLYVPAPRTMVAGVNKLPPGHLLLADARSVEVRRYFTPPVPGSDPSARARTPGLRSALAEAVRLQLVSDVPVAALLSGGLDSSAVVALMAEELGPGVRTFAVGFGRADDELPFARLLAERHRTEHREIIIDRDVAAQTQDAFAAFSEPIGDSSAVPTVAVCREVAREVKVVLTGDGGDELFAGYDRYRQLAALPHLPGAGALVPLLRALPATRLGSRLRRAARAVGAKGGAARYRALIEVFPLKERRALLGQSAQTAQPLPELSSSEVDCALAFDLGTYLPDDLLFKVDTSAMRFGLEARCPLLDPALAALAVPPAVREKQGGIEGKLLLRAAVKDLLPPEILLRKKRGFGSPVESWLRGPLLPMLQDLVRAKDARLRGHLDGAAIDRALDGAVTGRGNAHQAWALLALESWLRR